MKTLNDHSLKKTPWCDMTTFIKLVIFSITATVKSARSYEGVNIGAMRDRNGHIHPYYQIINN